MEEHQHLTPETLARFLEHDRGEEGNALLLHLLSVCPGCNATGGDLLDFYRSGAMSLSFCSIDVELARSRAAAPALLAELARVPYVEALGRIEEGPRFQTWGLTELLSAESERAAPADAGRAVEFAELGVAVGSLLSEWQPAEASWLCQLRAITWAALANARRVLGEIRSAKDAFREADRFFALGEDAGDALGYEAHYLALKASLRREERRFPEALALLDRAIAAEGGPALRGPILVNRASVLEASGDFEGAITALREAELHVDPLRERRLFFGLRHNLLLFLATSGRHEDAAAMLEEVSSLCREIGNELDLVRLRWAEARIAHAAGDRERAGRLLAEVRQEFLSRGIVYDSALASLELAVLFAEAGNTAAVKAAAREILPIFEAQQIRREALAVISLVADAGEDEVADAALLRKLAEYLMRARYNRELPFKR